MIYIVCAKIKRRLTLELPKLFLPTAVKMTGLLKIHNNRIFFYLLIYYFLTEGIQCYVVHFWYH